MKLRACFRSDPRTLATPHHTTTRHYTTRIVLAFPAPPFFRFVVGLRENGKSMRQQGRQKETLTTTATATATAILRTLSRFPQSPARPLPIPIPIAIRTPTHRRRQRPTADEAPSRLAVGTKRAKETEEGCRIGGFPEDWRFPPDVLWRRGGTGRHGAR